MLKAPVEGDDFRPLYSARQVYIIAAALVNNRICNWREPYLRRFRQYSVDTGIQDYGVLAHSFRVSGLAHINQSLQMCSASCIWGNTQHWTEQAACTSQHDVSAGTRHHTSTGIRHHSLGTPPAAKHIPTRRTKPT